MNPVRWTRTYIPIWFDHKEGALATAGACCYIALFATPVWWGIPLIILSLSATITLFCATGNRTAALSPLTRAAFLFLFAVAASVLLSADPPRSLMLSAPLVPAFLIYFLVAENFQDPEQTRLLCLTLSLISLVLAGSVLWTAWRAPWMSTYGWAANMGSPIVIVPNDATLMSLVCPLSLALVLGNPRAPGRVLALLSLLLSVWAMCVLRSRVAVLTVTFSIAVAALLMRPRLALACALAILIVGLGADATMGFPLLAKFGQLQSSDEGVSGRLLLWSAAWSSFLGRPILGHGPGTFTYEGVNWTHNLYLQTLAEMGVVGLLALLLLLCVGLSAGWAARRSGYGAAAFAALLGFCFAAFFELTLSREWVAVFLFTCLGIVSQLHLREKCLRSTRPPVELDAIADNHAFVGCEKEATK